MKKETHESKLWRRTPFRNNSLTDDPRYSIYTSLGLLEKRIETTRMEFVPVNLVVQEEIAIDETHVRSLAESMIGSRGQISPLTVRARLLEGSDIIHYDVIDGFHRAAGLMLIKREKAKCVVVYGCSDEELYDLRVLAANSVRSVQFARVAKWMQNSFASSEWAQKGLSLSQMFSMAVSDTTKSYHGGLTLEETVRAKEWVKEKAKKWNRPVGSIYSDIRSVEQTAPDIVAQVRIGGGGHRKGTLTPARLRAIIGPLPYHENFDFQRRIVASILKYNILAEEAGILAKEVDRWRDNPTKLEQIFTQPLQIIESALKESMHISAARVQIKSGTSPLRLREKNVEQPPSYVFRWWRYFPNLSDEERTAFKSFFDSGFSIEGAAFVESHTTTELFRLLQSGMRKYSLHLDELDNPKKQE